MSLTDARPLGTSGLNLSTLAEAADLVVADRVRFVQDGSLSTSLGRLGVTLSWPDEGITDDAGVPVTGYSQTLPNFAASGRVRGLTPYYDQRVSLIAAATTTTNINAQQIPSRLNFVYKASGSLWFNDSRANDASGILTGDGLFDLVDTRAKLVGYGDRVYIVDESTVSKVMYKKPKASQANLTRTKYEVLRNGIRWPTDTAQAIPTPTTVAVGASTIAAGTYRFRIIIEDQYGIQSNASMPGTFTTTTDLVNFGLVVKWGTLIATWPTDRGSFKVRVYVQFGAYADTSIEPSDYVFLRQVLSTNDDSGGGTEPNSIRVIQSDLKQLRFQPIMPTRNGYPPKLKDLIIVNDVAVGIAMPDKLFRETFKQEYTRSETSDVINLYRDPVTHLRFSDGLAHPVTRHFSDSKLTSTTIITEVPVDSSYVFWSEPGAPEYMENWIQIGKGAEIAVGLADLGGNVVIFSNVAIYVLDVSNISLKRAYSKVGCMSRDSIVETEKGILFMGSDGIPRIFNGATTDEIAEELLPVFAQPDYSGPYKKFDRNLASEVSGVCGDRRAYFSYPVTNEATTIPGKPIVTEAAERNLAVADLTHPGRVRWALDRIGYEQIYWLGRESRLLGIDSNGLFYYLEEGFTWLNPPDGNPSTTFEVQVRRFASASGQHGNFVKAGIDLDAGGGAITATFMVDENPSLSFSLPIGGNGRRLVKTYLPGNMRGRFLDVRLYGQASTLKRMTLYAVTVEAEQREVF